MTDEVAAPRRRATQERSVKTRERILDAAVSCLAEDGYASTTTVTIQQRAGVSRGRLLHHFPSKDALLIAAVDHLVTRRAVELTEQIADLPVGEPRIGRAIELLWSTFDTPFFWAAMELWLAARTDEALREALVREERRLAVEIRRLLDALFGEAYAQAPNFDAVGSILISSMRGHALTLTFTPGAQRDDQNLDAWKWAVRRLLAPPAG